MRGIRGAFIRLALAIVFGLVSFWPDYGLVFIAVRLFTDHPLLVIAAAAVWASFLFLLLPVPLRMFGRVSTLMLALIMGVGIFSAASSGLVSVASVNFWLTWGVAAAFSLIGWLLVATPLWRFFHGVVAVQDTAADHHS